MSIFSKTKKSAAQPPRTLPVINQDYNQRCLRAGEIQFNMKKYEAELFQLNQELAKLQVEYQGAQKALAEANPPVTKDPVGTTKPA